MKIIYILIFILAFVIFHLISFLIKKEKSFEEKIHLLIESRVVYLKQQEKRNQQQIINLKFKEWRLENEFEIRRTAIKRANVSILDSISDEVDIVKENFSFNPKDVKFIGRFIDLIVFDGAANEEKVSIYLVNIIQENNPDMKHYKSLVKKAIENKKVFFKEINL